MPTDPPAAALDVAGLRTLVAGASPMPWVSDNEPQIVDGNGYAVAFVGAHDPATDQALIVAAVNALPQLLAIAEAAAAYVALLDEARTPGLGAIWGAGHAIAADSRRAEQRLRAALREVT
jgi:hypothetical protein